MFSLELLGGSAMKNSRPVVLMLAVALIAVACASTDDGAQSPAPSESVTPTEPGVVAETRTVIGRDGGVATVGQASLTVPAGSLPAGTRIVAQQLEAAELLPSELAVAAVPGPVRFLADGEVTGPLTVRIPLLDGVNDVRILSAEEGSVLWFDETTEVIDGFATAEVDHLTDFAVVAATVSNLSYTLFQLLGSRASGPDCPLGTPDWVFDIVSVGQEYIAQGLRPNSPTIACGDRARRNGKDVLALRVTANRAYSVVVSSSAPIEARRPASSGRPTGLRGDATNAFLTSVADGIGRSLRQRYAGFDGLYAIPPTFTSEFLVADPLDGKPGMRTIVVSTVSPLNSRAIALSVLVDLFAISIDQIPSLQAEKAAACVQSGIGSDGTDGVQQAVDIFNACIGIDAALDTPGLARLANWARRAQSASQVALLVAERSADTLQRDRIEVFVQNIRPPAAEIPVAQRPTTPPPAPRPPSAAPGTPLIQTRFGPPFPQDLPVAMIAGVTLLQISDREPRTEDQRICFNRNNERIDCANRCVDPPPGMSVEMCESVQAQVDAMIATDWRTLPKRTWQYLLPSSSDADLRATCASYGGLLLAAGVTFQHHTSASNCAVSTTHGSRMATHGGTLPNGSILSVYVHQDSPDSRAKGLCGRPCPTISVDLQFP
jgi:hypothetical protein